MEQPRQIYASSIRRRRRLVPRLMAVTALAGAAAITAELIRTFS